MVVLRLVSHLVVLSAAASVMGVSREEKTPIINTCLLWRRSPKSPSLGPEALPSK